MKKKILSFILAICLVIPCAFMFSSCGEDDDVVLPNGAFTVKGKTFEITDEVRIIWDEGLSDTLKSTFLQFQNNGVPISEADFVARVKKVAIEMKNKHTELEFSKEYDDDKKGYKIIISNDEKSDSSETYYQPDDCSYVGYGMGTVTFDGDCGTIMYVGDGKYGLVYGGYRPGDNPSPHMMNTNIVIILKVKQ
ncbi:MAG: hypothetical protein IJ398_02675 [Clostridia bacterium]|nr:hypothetical protein [Clostridia bacterium]